MQIIATDWPPADEIDLCNDDLVMTITKVIASNKIQKKLSDFISRFLFGLTLISKLNLKTDVNKR